MCLHRLNEAQQSAFQDITNVANERRQLSDELESLRSQFKAYQRVKTREISSLDHRVRILLQSQAVAGTMRPDELANTSAAAAAGQHKPVSVRYAIYSFVLEVVAWSASLWPEIGKLQPDELPVGSAAAAAAAAIGQHKPLPVRYAVIFQYYGILLRVCWILKMTLASD